MSTIRIKASAGLAVAAVLGLISTPVQAYDFTPEGISSWVRIGRALTVAIDSGNEQTSVCDGINVFAATHDFFRKEVMTTRDWAPKAHVQVCLGLHSDANGNGVKCKDYKRAVGELAKAQPATDPAEAVAVAGQLKDSLNSMIADLQVAGLC